MFHTFAYFNNISTTVDTDMTPITDQVLTIQNGHFIFPQDVQLFAAAFMEATPARARLVTPSLRIPSTPFLRPLMTGAVPPNIPVIPDYRANPLRIPALEELQILATSGLAMGNEHATGVLWAGDAITPAPAGNIVTMRGTSTTAAVVQTWTPLTVTWQDTLPYGTYAIVGLHHQSANGQACRLNINNQQWRPGCLSVTALGNFTVPMFHKGGLGQWGTFRSTAMPIPEVLCDAANAVHEVYLEFIKVG